MIAVASGSRLIATYRLVFIATNASPKPSTVRSSCPVQRTRHGRVSRHSSAAAATKRSETVPSTPAWSNSVAANAAPSCTDATADTAQRVPTPVERSREEVTPARYGPARRRGKCRGPAGSMLGRHEPGGRGRRHRRPVPAGARGDRRGGHLHRRRDPARSRAAGRLPVAGAVRGAARRPAGGAHHAVAAPDAGGPRLLRGRGRGAGRPGGGRGGRPGIGASAAAGLVLGGVRPVDHRRAARLARAAARHAAGDAPGRRPRRGPARRPGRRDRPPRAGRRPRGARRAAVHGGPAGRRAGRVAAGLASRAHPRGARRRGGRARPGGGHDHAGPVAVATTARRGCGRWRTPTSGCWRSPPATRSG